MNSILFDSEIEPVAVGGGPGGYVYLAGKLSPSGRNSSPAIFLKIKRYLKDCWNWDVEKNREEAAEKADEEAVGVANFLQTDRAFYALLADYSRKLTPGDLLKWGESFLDRVYDEIIRLNPKLDKDRAAELEALGQAQEETRNGNGQVKSQEELVPLA